MPLWSANCTTLSSLTLTGSAKGSSSSGVWAEDSSTPTTSPLPTGKSYQLWIITNKPISAGVFTLDHGHKGRLLLRDIPGVSQIKKFAVSLEPAGGRPQPTGSIYLAGDL